MRAYCRKDAVKCSRMGLSRLWELESQRCSKGARTKDFLPSTRLPATLPNLSIYGRMTQVLTGHCYLRSHLFRIGLANSPQCICGLDEKTVSHVLFHCPLLDSLRADFKTNVCSNVWPPNVKMLCESQSSFAALNKFVERCGRFESDLLCTQPMIT